MVIFNIFEHIRDIGPVCAHKMCNVRVGLSFKKYAPYVGILYF
jgi:hypothetical protein